MSIKKNILCGCIVAFTLLFVNHSIAGTYQPINTLLFRSELGLQVEWMVTAYQEDAGKKYPIIPAKICFSREKKSSFKQCEIVDGVEVMDLEVIKFTTIKDQSGVLFSTNTWGMGGGPSYLTLWVYDERNNRFRNILPTGFHVPALGMHKFIPSIRNNSILLVASPATYISGDINDPKRETLWSPHIFELTVYKYSKLDEFTLVKSFNTKRKYDPEIDFDIIIEAEMKNIINALN